MTTRVIIQTAKSAVRVTRINQTVEGKDGEVFEIVVYPNTTREFAVWDISSLRIGALPPTGKET